MANITFDLLWREAMTDLLDQLETENPEDQSLIPTEPSELFQHHACLYIRYIQIYTKLEECYDQIVHPQKRLDIKKVLESTLGRILEIKDFLVKLEDREYINLDDILVDLKLRPEVLDLPIPTYFLEERKAELQERDRLMNALMMQAGIKDPTLVTRTPWEQLGQEMTLEQAVRCIQLNERGRQGRSRATYMRAIRKEEEREKRHAEVGELETDPELAAVSIQKLFRGYSARKKTQDMRAQELQFLGMTPPTRSTDPENSPVAKMVREKQRRKFVQDDHLREYGDAIVTLGQKVTELEGPDVRDAMTDKIRQWFIHMRETTGKFPDYPAIDQGGSTLILHPPPPLTQEELDAIQKAKEEEEAAKKKGKRGESRPASPTKTANGTSTKKGGKKGKDEPPEEPPKPALPRWWVEPVQQGVAQYCRVWQERDESWNVQQKHDPELVKQALRPGIEEKIRLEVDEALRVELENLKIAVERAKAAGKKGKKGGKGGGKKKKGGKSKKAAKGKGKGKKKKDPTSNRSIESLFAELVANSIIRKYPRIRLQDYVGDFNFLGSTMQKAGSATDPSIAQVRQMVAEYCILPLGSPYVHEHAPCPKTVLLYGSRGNGKSMLTHAIASESGALLFDLSPSNTDGKYPGKHVALLLHMVFKVAKAMPPAVVYIDEIERVFASDKAKGGKKKKAGEAGLEPGGRIKKDLLAQLKDLTLTDRVLVVGNSRQPFKLDSAAARTAFVSFFNKIVCLPRPDYASRQMIWQAHIERMGGSITPALDMQTLARISEGYSSASISDAVQMIITKRRLATLDKRPLVAADFLAPLSKMDPVYLPEDELWQRWTENLPRQGANQYAILKPPEPVEDKKPAKGKDKGAKKK